MFLRLLNRVLWWRRGKAKPTFIFVYGTLKRDQRNHGLLAKARFVQTATTLPRYRMYDRGSSPALVPNPEGGNAILGEIYEVDARTLQRLDRHEGVPRVYIREAINLADFAEPVEAYFYCRDISRLPGCGSCWPASVLMKAIPMPAHHSREAEDVR